MYASIILFLIKSNNDLEKVKRTTINILNRKKASREGKGKENSKLLIAWICRPPNLDNQFYLVFFQTLYCTSSFLRLVALVTYYHLKYKYIIPVTHLDRVTTRLIHHQLTTPLNLIFRAIVDFTIFNLLNLDNSILCLLFIADGNHCSSQSFEFWSFHLHLLFIANDNHHVPYVFRRQHQPLLLLFPWVLFDKRN